MGGPDFAPAPGQAAAAKLPAAMLNNPLHGHMQPRVGPVRRGRDGGCPPQDARDEHQPMDSVRSRPAVPWVVAAFTAAALVGLGVNAASFFATHSGANLATTALLRTATLVSTLKDAETGIRGYLLTGNDAYLEPYNHAVATFDAQLSQARAALGDDAGWLGRLERIDKLSRETLSKVRDTLQAHSFQGSSDARAIADLSEGKALMDAIRS